MDKPDAMETSHAAHEEARHGDNRQPFRSRRLPPTMEDWGELLPLPLSLSHPCLVPLLRPLFSRRDLCLRSLASLQR